MKTLNILSTLWIFMISSQVVAQNNCFSRNYLSKFNVYDYQKYAGIHFQHFSNERLCFEQKLFLNVKQNNSYSRLLLPQNHPNLLYSVEDKQQGNKKPSLKGGRIAGEFLLGGVGAAALGCLGFIAAGSDLEGSGGGMVFMVLGGICLGGSTGVCLAGNVGNETGSYGVTLLGSIVGLIPAVSLAEPTNGISLLIFPLICATIGFNISREYDSPSTTRTAIINFIDGKMNSGIPLKHFQPSHLDGKTLLTNMDLISVRF